MLHSGPPLYLIFESSDLAGWWVELREGRGGLDVIIIDFTHCLHSSLPPHTQIKELGLAESGVRALCLVPSQDRTRDKDKQHQPRAPAPTPVNLSDTFQQIWRGVLVMVS